MMKSQTLCFDNIPLLCAPFTWIITADMEECEQQVVLFVQLGGQFYFNLQGRQNNHLFNVLKWKIPDESSHTWHQKPKRPFGFQTDTNICS